MTSREQLNKATHDVMLGTKEFLQTKLMQARARNIITISDEQFTTLLALATGAVEAAYNRSLPSFERSTQDILEKENE